MHPPRTRWGARILLLACLTMLIETTCSHVPPPDTRADVHSAIKTNEGSGAVMRFHTISGITIVTSHYSMTDSTVVIGSLLREPKYYRPAEAKLHQESLNPPPKETVLPLEVPLNEIRSVDIWEPRSVKSDMAIGGAVVIVAIGAIVVFALYYFGKVVGGFSAD